MVMGTPAPTSRKILYRASLSTPVPARFLSRPNRFKVIGETASGAVEAYLPNPGRLWELLVPDAMLLLEKSSQKEGRRTAYTVIAVETPQGPVMLHTHRSNDAARWLLDRGMIPGWEDARVIRREVAFGSSRFDFLLEGPEGTFPVEVKSCTLFGERMAMFPDAPSERAARHVSHLAGLAKSGPRPGVLFLVHSLGPRYFLPDLHTDLDFARTLLEARESVDIKPVGIRWNSDLTLEPGASLLEIPWRVLEENAFDSGGYVLVLKLEKDLRLAVGKLGEVDLKAGYYCYVGSAVKGLTARMERHRRRRKNLHWHVDYLREVSLFVVCLPVRSSVPVECDMAHALEGIADERVPGFGCSDCLCRSHLFRFALNPLGSEPFIKTLLRFRIDRLV
ncbi:MAG: DNA/RNA nuclease SfsA [Thermovirgaceae bacterium]